MFSRRCDPVTTEEKIVAAMSLQTLIYALRTLGVLAEERLCREQNYPESWLPWTAIFPRGM